jgi:hypothetical protein
MIGRRARAVYSCRLFSVLVLRVTGVIGALFFAEDRTCLIQFTSYAAQ